MKYRLMKGEGIEADYGGYSPVDVEGEAHRVTFPECNGQSCEVVGFMLGDIYEEFPFPIFVSAAAKPHIVFGGPLNPMEWWK